MRGHRLFRVGFFAAIAGILSGLVATESGHAATRSPLTVLHSFSGAANDGAFPTYGTSLAVSGATLYGITQSGGAATNGVLFKMNASGSGFSVLHSFNGYSPFLNVSGAKNDGAAPTGTPVLDGSTLYGLTTMGGSNGVGTLYRINTDGSGFEVLHHFGASASDGSFPSGSLVLSDSSLFGMTESGGTAGPGVIFRIGADGSGYRILHSFLPTANDGADGIGSLVVSGSALYGMTRFGGNSGNGVVFTLNTNGSGFHLLHHLSAQTTDVATPYGSLIVNGSTLYGMGSEGGANNVGAVFKIGTDGGGFELLHSFALNEGWQPFGDVTLVNGQLYGMTHVGGSGGLGSGVLFRLGTNGAGYEVLHTFNYSYPVAAPMTPFGSLALGGSSLYGMSCLGGSKNHGCVFSYALGAGSTPPGVAELQGTFSKITETCKTRRGVLGCLFGAALTIQNSGTAMSALTHIRYVFSADGTYDPSIDTQFGSATLGKVKQGKSRTLRLKAKTTESVSGKYLLAVDDTNTVLASLLLGP